MKNTSKARKYIDSAYVDMNVTVDNNKNLTIERAIEGFPNYLHFTTRKRPTAEAYMNDIQHFKRFLNEELKGKIRYLDKLTKVIIRQYIIALTFKVRTSKIKPTTAMRRVNALRVFITYLKDDYNICTNLLENIERIKLGYFEAEVGIPNDNVRETLSKEEIEQLLLTVRRSNHRNAIRDNAILSLLIDTGCRREDIINFKWNDIKFFEEELIISRNKTNVTNTVKIHKSLLNALSDLKYTQDSYSPNPYIFTGSNNKGQISPNAVSCLVKRWSAESGITKNVSPSTFRHTFVTTCIRQGISPNKITRYTGHKSTGTLKYYYDYISQDSNEIAELFGNIAA